MAEAEANALWATASRTYVIPPRPKPGRKPKKDLVQPVENDDSECKPAGRRVQNRAAQRAFRERKQSQLAELQARLQSYEQGEIDRTVGLQTIAKRLKEDNDALRRENQLLKDRLGKLDPEQKNQTDDGKKRSRDDAPCDPPSKRNKIEEDQHDQSPDLARLLDLSAQSKPNYEPPAIFYCGFCSQDTRCVCREIIFQPSEMNHPKFDNLADNLVPPSTILDNLPPYQPALPLKKKPGAKPKPIFRILDPARNQVPTCSGDPDNCMACANDSFGKEFCAAIGKSIVNCVDCPDQPETSSAGDPDSLSPPSPPVDHDETMPTNAAWQTLKSHPNVAFTDLALLADVVARRSKCTGPRLHLSPTPELGDPAMDVDRRTRNNRRPETPPRLVPQDILVKCGQQRLRQVQAAGVRDALRLLDAKFAQ